MVKNILLKSLFEITDKQQGHKPEKMLAGNAYEIYQQMQQISIESFKKNLQGNWELIELTGQQPTLQAALRFTMKRTQELWQQHGPCNILYADPDTLCIKPLDVFGKFTDFRIFTNHDPLSSKDYHNCGVRYFPSRLPETFWNEMNGAMSVWNDQVHYAFEQDIYRHLMYTQADLLSTPQSWVVQQCGLQTPMLKDVPKYPPVIHIFASQNPGEKLKLMMNFWQALK